MASLKSPVAGQVPKQLVFQSHTSLQPRDAAKFQFRQDRWRCLAATERATSSGEIFHAAAEEVVAPDSIAAVDFVAGNGNTPSGTHASPLDDDVSAAKNAPGATRPFTAAVDFDQPSEAGRISFEHREQASNATTSKAGLTKSERIKRAKRAAAARDLALANAAAEATSLAGGALVYPPEERRRIRSSWARLMRWSRSLRSREAARSAERRLEKVVVFGGVYLSISIIFY